MNEIKKDLENLRQKNMQLKNKNELPKTQQIEEDIKQKMKKKVMTPYKKGCKNSL